MMETVLLFVRYYFSVSSRYFFASFRKLNVIRTITAAIGNASNNTYRLKVAHRTVGEYQCDRKCDQKDAPHQFDQLVRRLIFPKLVITIAGSDQCDRIKGCRIKGNHCDKQ